MGCSLKIGSKKVEIASFKELQQEIQIGIEAAERGEVVDAKEVFQRLREKQSQNRMRFNKL